MKTSYLCWLFVFALIATSFSLHICAENDIEKDPHLQSRSLIVNIISYKSGVGLNQDIDILQTELTKLGHEVHFINVNDLRPHQKADINVFVQTVDSFFFPIADKNYLIPNPEWCFCPPAQIAQFDMILCKTKEAERIFKPYNANTVFLGFTSKDRYDETQTKNYTLLLHLAGNSSQKGTNTLVKTWLANPQFPELLLIKHKGTSHYPPAENLKVIYEYVSDSEITSKLNSCGMHLCPSETEGFGHYIAEGQSCGAIVVTTDAPPMNELVTDKRCLVSCSSNAPMRWATNYYYDSDKLDKVITDLLSLPEEELEAIGRKNREQYLQNDRLFKQRFAEIFRSDFVLKPKLDSTEIVFTNIYEKKLWGNQPSGDGSIPENTKLYRFFLQNFLKENHIQHVVEIGCGDWDFSCLIDWEGIQYEGYDVYKAIIEKNQAVHSSPTIKFIHGNAIHMDLPKADLLICKDVLQHLPQKEIMQLLPQLQKFKHCLLTNEVDPESLTSANLDIPSYAFTQGCCRTLDLSKSPFNLKGKKVLTFSSDVTKQVFYIKN